MKKYWMAILAAAALMLLGLSACSNQKTAEETRGNQDAQENHIFGEFTTQTLEGEDVDQEIFSASALTMVNIWATFCSPCINEMPDLGEISRSYDTSEFQIIGLISDVMEPGDERAVEIVESTKADYTHLIASDDLMSGILGKVNVVPTTVFVDRDGVQVGGVYAGSKSMDSWKQIIEKNLEESGS